MMRQAWNDEAGKAGLADGIAAMLGRVNLVQRRCDPKIVGELGD